MKFVHLLLTMAITFSATTISARSGAPIVNYDKVTFTTISGKKPSAAEIQQAITRGALQTQWVTSSAGDNKLVATINVRNKHTVAVDISWTPGSFSIHYKNSINMNFEAPSPDEAPSSGLIHPHYNKWVSALHDNILRELSLL